jgi:hypothetical protein
MSICAGVPAKGHWLSALSHFSVGAYQRDHVQAAFFKESWTSLLL